MIKLKLLCPHDGVTFFSTRKSFKGIKVEQEKCFYSNVHYQTVEISVEMSYDEICLDWFEVLKGYPFCCLIWSYMGKVWIIGAVYCKGNESMRTSEDFLFAEHTMIKLHSHILSEWLVMMIGSKGRSFYLIWSCGGIVLICVGGEEGTKVAVIHRCSFACNDSSCKWRMESQLLVTVRMQLWGCHGEMFKVQSKATQSIGKWFHNAELDVKSKGDRLKHIADAQVSERATEVERFRLKDLKHKPLIREAINMGMRTEYQDFVPLHSNTINCMMKSTQSCSHKIPSTPLILLSKLMGIISFDAREIELVMIMLKWGAKNVGIKGSIAELLVLKAKSIKTIKSVIEWMIAWENKSVLSSGDKKCSMMMGPWN